MLASSMVETGGSPATIHIKTHEKKGLGIGSEVEDEMGSCSFDEGENSQLDKQKQPHYLVGEQEKPWRRSHQHPGKSLRNGSEIDKRLRSTIKKRWKSDYLVKGEDSQLDKQK